MLTLLRFLLYTPADTEITPDSQQSVEDEINSRDRLGVTISRQISKIRRG